ncbi:C4-dicarboxylate-specific signal transduction histidine kinase [Rhodopseudomonas rhenobacensis]|uniref:histidine kinase n=1 Tax=Rhodopseudomonas rhenobacensis TaxID=87461 RepID=A0A7W8DYS4_9BRAD|nr:C4-dicarboxylate-specific signal transduction histidine kinase [Rhodopseudomonas rhenobacensis]
MFVVATLALAYSLMQIRENSTWVRHTNDVLRLIAGIERAVLQAESGERGYLLTRVDEYREAYETAKSTLPHALDELVHVLGDNAEQQRNLAAVRSSIEMRLTQLQRVVELAQTDLQTSLDILEQARVDLLTQRIEHGLSAMTKFEQAQLKERQHNFERSNFAAAAVAACLVVLALASGVVGAFLIERQRAMARQQASDSRLRELQSELLHVARLGTMGEMSAALAHELNQPLAAIANYLKGSRRLLQDSTDKSADRIRTALDKAADQALRAGEVIQRLRQFVSRGETEKTNERLDRIVDDAVSLALVVAKDREVKVSLDLDPAAERVLVDRVQIQQLLLNLIRNALEAMEHQDVRELQISSSRGADGMIEMTVADNGPGIDPQLMDRLFLPFMTTKTAGMGVGLSLCRTIVTAHGGSIRAEPRDGAGTAFRFTIPSAEVI